MDAAVVVTQPTYITVALVHSHTRLSEALKTEVQLT